MDQHQPQNQPVPPVAPVPPAPGQPVAGQSVVYAENPGQTLGIVGIILNFFGIGLGGIILGVMSRSKSKAVGASTTLGTVSLVWGIIATVLTLLWVIFMIVMFVIAAVASDSSTSSSDYSSSSSYSSY